jgi:hypothetical protein
MNAEISIFQERVGIRYLYSEADPVQGLEQRRSAEVKQCAVVGLVTTGQGRDEGRSWRRNLLNLSKRA